MLTDALMHWIHLVLVYEDHNYGCSHGCFSLALFLTKAVEALSFGVILSGKAFISSKGV